MIKLIMTDNLTLETIDLMYYNNTDEINKDELVSLINKIENIIGHLFLVPNLHARLDIDTEDKRMDEIVTRLLDGKIVQLSYEDNTMLRLDGIEMRR